jgi:hypothetical protein
VYAGLALTQEFPGGRFNLNNWAANWQAGQPDSTLSTISVTNGVLTIS